MRRDASASSAEIKRELAILKRAYSLALADRKVLAKPTFEKLPESSVRQGFFELEQFQAVWWHLPSYLRPMVTFMYITGWRSRSEVFSLTWRQVDFEAGFVRLDVGTTKNKDGRQFPLTDELRALLLEQREHTRALEREKGAIIKWVFHRDGEPIRDIYGAWRSACCKAGCPDRIPHDFRRTAARNLVRSGIPEGVAQKLTEHRTRAVFERYCILAEGDLLAAAKRLNLAAGTISGTTDADRASSATGYGRK